MIEYDFDPTHSITHITVSGDLGDAELLDWFRAFLDEIRDAKRLGGLIDTRGLTDLNVTSDTIYQLTRLAATREDVFAGSRWAVVADSDFAFGLARMYEMIRDGAPYEIRVFREMEPAREWFEETV